MYILDVMTINYCKIKKFFFSCWTFVPTKERNTFAHDSNSNQIEGQIEIDYDIYFIFDTFIASNNVVFLLYFFDIY